MLDTRRRVDPGTIVLDRFVIDARVGAGGMGTVYRAHDRASGAPVAVKVVTDGAADSARFLQEARLLGELEHAAIVRYIAHGAGPDGRTYLVMEWLEGQDLASRLERGPLSIEETLELAERLTDALAHAHARGVVHRDVKPSNVLLVRGASAQAKVLDFGIARVRGATGFDATMLPITRTGVVIGTVGYMSPEQARGAPDIDARTDVFALGCVLYECLTGKPAFSGPNAVAVLAKVLIEDVPRARTLRRDLPRALDELVSRMLERRPADRPRDAAAIRRALSAIGTDGSRRTPSTGDRVADREQRLVSVVVVRGGSGDLARAALPDLEILELAGGVLVLALRGADPVSHAAAAALTLRTASPAASIAIATGRIETTHDGLLGPVIDRAATMLGDDVGICVDEVSASLLGGRFELDAMSAPDGRRWLRGPARHGEPRTLLGRPTPCVGRDKELALLESTVRESMEDEVARALLVTGPAGAGKSRLGYELLARLDDEASVLFARADPLAAGSSLSLVRQLVRGAAELRESDPAETQREVLRGYLARLFTAEALDRVMEALSDVVVAPTTSGRVAANDPRARAAWTRRAFVEWLSAECDARPLVAVLEDVHWGDRGSVAAIEDALVVSGGRPLCVIAFARPEVRDVFPDLFDKTSVQELRLAPLTRRACQRLIQSVLVDADAPQIERVIQRSEGNAFCLEELIRHVAEHEGAALPESVLALAEARVAGLSGAHRRVLRAASVLGEVLWDRGVAAILDDDAEEIARALDELVSAEVLREQPRSRLAEKRELAFRHGLLRDAVYATCTEDDRALAHGRAGLWLAAAGENDPQVLAIHFERSDAPARAVPYLASAAQRALDSLDLVASDALASRALALDGEASVQGSLLVIQALAAVASADRPRALRAAKAAYGLVPAGSANAYLAAAMVLQNGAYLGDVELAPRVVQDVLAREPVELTGAYGLAVQMVVDLLDNLGDRESAERLLDKGIRLADAAAPCDPAYLGWLAYARGAAALRRDRLAAALVHVDEARAAFDGVGAWSHATGFIDFAHGALMLELGQPARGRELLRLARQRFSSADASWFESWCVVSEGWTYFAEGRLDDALVCGEAVLATAEHRHGRALLTYVHLERGDLDAAERAVTLALDGIDDFLVVTFVAALVHAAHASLQLARGRAADALAAVERADRSARGTFMPTVRSMVEHARVRALRALGDTARADAALREATQRLARARAELPPELQLSYVERVPANAALSSMTPSGAEAHPR